MRHVKLWSYPKKPQSDIGFNGVPQINPSVKPTLNIGKPCCICGSATRGSKLYCRHHDKMVRTARNYAVGVVAAAIRRGELAVVTTLTCADCGQPAQAYDHRDYSKPLEVTPVCIRCNFDRGPAVTDFVQVGIALMTRAVSH